MRELIEINSVMVQGALEGPRQVIVLTLGIEQGETSQDPKVSLLLGEWGANAIFDQLKAAGVTGSVQEQPQEEPTENALDIIDV